MREVRYHERLFSQIESYLGADGIFAALLLITPGGLTCLNARRNTGDRVTPEAHTTRDGTTMGPTPAFT
jgi:hypothetical protein